ncbi:MAG: serine/threonine-protein kinase [Planctomycetota bacterium]
MSNLTKVSDDEFLEIAVRQKLLSRDDATRVSKAAVDSGSSLAALCIEQGLLRPVQVDVIQGLAEKDDLAPGYEVIDLLGYGGLGIVYRARQPKLDRMVALKTIPMQRIENPSVIKRFQQEAKAIGKLKHPNIVAAYDFGTHRERLFLAMELVEGRDVDGLIKSSGQVSEALAWSLAQQVAAGLAQAAQHSLVHRDIKPANLLLTKPPAGYPLPPGVPLLKITDFGLVQLEVPDTDSTRLTMGGTSLGTPHYMAPEQVADAHVDSRADIYALGATVFHMIAGKPPFDGTSIGRVLAAKLKGDEGWIERLPQGTSPATIALLKQMLAQDPADRISDYKQLLESIRQALDGSLPTADLSSAETIDSLLTSDTSLDGLLTEDSIKFSIPRRQWLAGLAVAAISAIAALAYVVDPLGGQVAIPTTQLTPSSWERPLFNGVDLNGWTAIRGGWIPTEDDMHSRVLEGKGAIVHKLPTYTTSPADPLEHYGVRLKIDLHTADAAELHFEHADVASLSDKSPRCVLRLTEACVVLGRKPNRRGEFEPLSPNCPLPADKSEDSSHYHELRLERHTDHWRVLLNGIAVASKSIDPRYPNEAIQLVVDSGKAYFADVFVFELVSEQLSR